MELLVLGFIGFLFLAGLRETFNPAPKLKAYEKKRNREETKLAEKMKKASAR